MKPKIQVAHDRRTDEYFLAHVMYDDDGENWFAFQPIDGSSEEILNALHEPILEHTSSEEELD